MTRRNYTPTGRAMPSARAASLRPQPASRFSRSGIAIARGACKSCLGTGQWLLMRSWFVGDGFRHERCHICKGSGQSTARNWMPEQAKFRRADAAMRAAPKGLDNAALGRLGCEAMGGAAMNADYIRCQHCGAKIELPEFDVAVAAVCADCCAKFYTASGMEAPSGGETVQQGSTEGDSPTAESGDAQ